MTRLQIDIIEPKAAKLLEDLAAMNLISIQSTNQDILKNLLNKLRVHSDDISMEEITNEVETVRAERYANRKE